MGGLEGKVESQDDKVDVAGRKFYTEAIAGVLEEAGLGMKERWQAKNIVDAILDEYIEENLANTKLFEASDGSAFPYAKFDSAEFARRIYQKFTGQKPPPVSLEASLASSKRSPHETRKTFLFSAGLTTAACNTFMHWEQHMQYLLMRLPQALADIQAGCEPEHNELYAVGSEVNLVGRFSKKFEEDSEKLGLYDAFGQRFAEFVASELPNEPEKKGNTEVTLRGQSVAASFAAKAAEHLLKNEQATQVPRAKAEQILARSDASQTDRTAMEASLKLPHVAVRADMPVGINEDASGIDIPLGFPAQIVDTLADPKSRAGVAQEIKMGQNIARQLKRRHGIEAHMDPEQKKIKESMIPNIIKLQFGKLTRGLMQGTPIPRDLRVTRLFGTRDPYAPSARRRAEAHEVGKKKGLLRHVTPSPSENMRTFVARGMRHEYPNLRKSDLSVLLHAVKAVEELIPEVR